MARRPIREFTAKKLIQENIAGFSIQERRVLITPETNLDELEQDHPWLSQTKLVAKPDQLFGKRKKHGLVLLNADLEETKEWVQEHQGKVAQIGKSTDKLTHFLIEPFTPHEQEYYLAFVSEREHDLIHFSTTGGIDIEENWGNVITIQITPLEDINSVDFSPIQDNKVINFIKALFNVYQDLDFSYLEINPFTFVEDEVVFLDTVAQLDDCALFKQQHSWKITQFPKEFGKQSFPQEDLLRKMDEESGASLKFTVLNPKGRIWTILAGGGASIIYLDMIANLGKGEEIANYGDLAGGPSQLESYIYAKNVIELMIKDKDEEGKILFILGCIANFTDVKKTFKGFIQAIEQYQKQLQEHNIRILIRRGGPNHEQGLKLIRETGKRLEIPMQVHGPETSMNKIIEIAGEYL